MKRYEGLFILDTAGKEETVKDTIDRIANDITTAGGKVETVQKMEKRPFSRVANKRHTSGFYVNIIFEGETSLLDQLKKRFANDQDVFRIMFSNAPAAKPAAAAA